MTDDVGSQNGGQPVWIVEDEPAAARLAADLCAAHGAEAAIFHEPLPYLTALRSSWVPRVVILDWRLENELSAALYMATRHRYPEIPVIYWTASVTSKLPSMLSGDELTVVVDKADGSEPFDRALSWALERADAVA
jgi:CheY-like chemotaxis protein